LAFNASFFALAKPCRIFSVCVEVNKDKKYK
jgi:hypothetical protein